MKKSKIFLLSGLIMYIIAVIFFVVAINNPCLSWTIPSVHVQIIYLSYAVINLVLFALFGVFSIKERRAEQKGFIGTIISLAVIAMLTFPIYYFVSVAPLLRDIFGRR